MHRSTVPVAGACTECHALRWICVLKTASSEPNALARRSCGYDGGVTYDELEPLYDRFEYLCGTSGTAKM